MEQRTFPILMWILLVLVILTAPAYAEIPPPEDSGDNQFLEVWDALIALQEQIADAFCTILALEDEVAGLKLENVWVSPLVAYPTGPNGPHTTYITSGICNASDLPCTPGALEITAETVVTEDDYQWVIFPLILPDGGKVTGVMIHYYINTTDPATTYIAQTRLSQMTTPDGATVMMDDDTDLYGPGPFEHTSFASYQVGGANILELKVVIGNPDDSIVIGGIEIFVER